ncbi:hypothetical protein LCGC14_0499470 [marine sediment metagenome]|uniref:Lipoprotein n=1 Tax=marine sediment metagenome TaxID=412755 RepID=A0A0F9SMW8_9ZZZZ
MKARYLVPAMLAVLFMSSGCITHYDPISIEQLSQKNQRVTSITEEVCEDFYVGARAFGEGPERAYPWLGRAREVDDANVVMRKQGVVCYSSTTRDLSSDGENRLLNAFKRTWRSAEEVIK